MMSRLTFPGRRSRSSRGVLAAAATVAAVCLAGPSSASAISGLERASGFSGGGTTPVQYATATCDDGKYVVGGGAWVHDGGLNRARVVSMAPLHRAAGGDSWQVIAETPGLTRSFSWSVAAYALCANSGALWDYKLEYASVGSTDRFKSTGARCLDGRVAWGSGATVYSSLGYGSGRIGLQLNRTSGPLDISRATARAESSYGENWTLSSIAICARPTMGITAVGQVAPGSEAEVSCSNYRVHGPGGGGGLTDGGPVWLRKIYPTVDLRRVQVELTGPLYPSIGGMVANATCAL